MVTEVTMPLRAETSKTSNGTAATPFGVAADRFAVAVVRKPNSVPHARRTRAKGDHFSGIRITADLKRPTRGDFVAPEPALPAYLVLLPVGFAVPRVSPRARRALTAPFHPYPPEAGGIFLLHFPSGCPAWTLSSTVSCAVRTFLIPIKRLPGRDRRATAAT